MSACTLTTSFHLLATGERQNVWHWVRGHLAFNCLLSYYTRSIKEFNKNLEWYLNTSTDLLTSESNWCVLLGKIFHRHNAFIWTNVNKFDFHYRSKPILLAKCKCTAVSVHKVSFLRSCCTQSWYLYKRLCLNSASIIKVQSKRWHC